MFDADLGEQSGRRCEKSREDGPYKPIHKSALRDSLLRDCLGLRPGVYNSRRGVRMATYLALMRWTKEGIEKIKDSPSRLDAARKAIEPAGAKLVSFYMLMGQYDMAAVIEAPDDATYARVSLSLASKAVSAWKLSAPLPRTNTGRSFQPFPNLLEHRVLALPTLRPHACSWCVRPCGARQGVRQSCFCFAAISDTGYCMSSEATLAKAGYLSTLRREWLLERPSPLRHCFCCLAKAGWPICPIRCGSP